MAKKKVEIEEEGLPPLPEGANKPTLSLLHGLMVIDADESTIYFTDGVSVTLHEGFELTKQCIGEISGKQLVTTILSMNSTKALFGILKQGDGLTQKVEEGSLAQVIFPIAKYDIVDPRFENATEEE